MTDPIHRREETSLQQLSAVSQARQIRLRSERQALSQRERAMAAAMDRQAMDEALLVQQRAVWSGRWQSWARAGGALRDAVSLRRDRELLTDMATLMAQQRAALQVEANVLALDLEAWTQRWRGTQAFDESLATRARGLRVSVERAGERQRDEDTLMTRRAAGDTSAALAMHR